MKTKRCLMIVLVVISCLGAQGTLYAEDGPATAGGSGLDSKARIIENEAAKRRGEKEARPKPGQAEQPPGDWFAMNDNPLSPAV